MDGHVCLDHTGHRGGLVGQTLSGDRVLGAKA